MPKLIIQIPCYNEAETLPHTLADLPRMMPGFDRVEWLVVDDGSDDDTAKVARASGADHVVRMPRNRGLARAFTRGLEEAVRLGADVIVNTDADNQYRAEDIPRLVAPILAGRADIVVGARPIATIEHFSFTKKLLQRIGSWVVRRVSGTNVPDAPSGFRAMSRRAALELKVFNEYSYTLETIIQAGMKGIAITAVPVGVNGPTRPSRLVRNVPGYVGRQILTILRIFMTYRPFPFFSVPGAASLLAGIAIGVRFLVFYVSGEGSGHIQSLLLGTMLMGTGFLLIVVGLLADLTAVNRKLLEGVDARLHRVEDGLVEKRGVDRRAHLPDDGRLEDRLVVED
jgi:glycosyltransferase involved in cell wall biosynthesis